MAFLRLTAFPALFALAACAGLPPTKGAFVPYDQVLAATAGLPIECSGFDAISDSCEGIGRSNLTGTSVRGEGQFLLEPGISVTAVVTGRLQGGQVCADPGSYRIAVTGMTRDEADFFSGLLEGTLDGLGTVCTSYFATSQPGVYITESRDAAGNLVPEGTDVSRFFAEPKPLRSAGP